MPCFDPVVLRLCCCFVFLYQNLSHAVLLFFCLQYHQWVCVASEGRAQAVPYEGAHPATHS